MTDSSDFSRRTTERCSSIFAFLAIFAVVTPGCSGSDSGPAPVGGMADAAGSASTSALGSTIPNRGGAGSGTAPSSSAGGSSNALQSSEGQSGGTRGSALIGPGGTGMGVSTLGGGATVGGRATTQSGALAGGGTKANAGSKNIGGVTSNGGAPSTGGTAAGGKAAGGTLATGDVGTGGNMASGGLPSGGGSGSGGNKATGGTKASGGTKATGGASQTASAAGTSGSAGALPALTIYIAGDSTVCAYTDTGSPTDQAGWGQMLPALFDKKVTIDNRASGGRTAYWFYLEGGVSKVLGAIKPGDYFFIQFGTNDQNETATFTVDGKTYPRFADAQTDFKTQLKQYYLDPTKAKGAVPVLVTPPPRNSAYCNGGNGLAAYASAMKELGAAEDVAVIDSNLKTFNYLKAICPKPATAADEKFFLGKSDGTIDGTHFRKLGASTIAGFIANGIREANLGLAAYLL
jgi:lysophospholipase L1-like esterase